MSKIQIEKENFKEANIANWKDSKISKSDFAIYKIHQEIDKSLDKSKPGYHCPIPKLIDVKVKRVHPLDNFSITMNKNFSALDQGLSIGITDTILDEEGLGCKPILNEIIQKKKLNKMKKRGEAYLENSVQFTAQSTDR